MTLQKKPLSAYLVRQRKKPLPLDIEAVTQPYMRVLACMQSVCEQHPADVKLGKLTTEVESYLSGVIDKTRMDAEVSVEYMKTFDLHERASKEKMLKDLQRLTLLRLLEENIRSLAHIAAACERYPEIATACAEGTIQSKTLQAPRETDIQKRLM